MALPALLNTRHPSTGVFTDEEIDYFDSLGPDYFPSEETYQVSESDWHYMSIAMAFSLLTRVFRNQPDVYIAANHFIYWDRRHKGLVVGPDLYVAKGVGRRQRDSYKVWEEAGHVPDVVFEFASESTYQKDLNEKKACYEQILQIPEYFLFDPIGGHYAQKLQGFRLEEGIYQPIQPIDGRLYSEQLDLELITADLYLRFFDPNQGELIPTPEEETEARTRAEAATAREAAARREAEAEVARLRAELEALRQTLRS